MLEGKTSSAVAETILLGHMSGIDLSPLRLLPYIACNFKIRCLIEELKGGLSHLHVSKMGDTVESRALQVLLVHSLGQLLAPLQRQAVSYKREAWCQNC